MLKKCLLDTLRGTRARFSRSCVDSKFTLFAHQRRRIASPAASFVSNAFEALQSQSLERHIVKNRYIAPLADHVLSKEEAIVTLQLCLDNNLHDFDVFANCIKLLQDEYFKPILLPDVNQERHPLVKRYDFADKPYEFIHSLSIENKVKIILWQWQVHKRGFPLVYINKDKPTTTQEIDPAKREQDETRKFGRVLDPKPLKAKFKVQPPGKRFSSLLALNLRQSIATASLSDLVLISLIFTTPLPFTGQLNEDTIRLLEQRFAEFTSEQLAPFIHPLSAFCRNAKQRFVDVWSFVNQKIPPGYKRHHLNKIEAQRLGKTFTSKISSALKAAKDINGFEIAIPINLPFNKLAAMVHTLWNLSYSDVAVTLEVWESQLDKIKDIAKEFDTIDAVTLQYFCEAVLGFKFTGNNTAETTRLLISKCNDLDECSKTIEQTIAFLNIKTNSTDGNLRVE